MTAAGGVVWRRFVLEGIRDVSAKYLSGLEPGIKTGKPRFSYTNTGFVNTDVFLTILEDIHEYCVESETPLPVLLFLDGASCHVSLEAVSLAQSLQIKLWLLYPNATHLLQPLDVSVFQPFKRLLRQAVWNWHGEVRNMSQYLTKYSIIPLVMQCLDSVFLNNKEIIKIGFKKSGIVPWNPEEVDFSMLLPSTKYKLDYKEECVLWRRGEKLEAHHEEVEQTTFAQKKRQEFGVNEDENVQVEMQEIEQETAMETVALVEQDEGNNATGCEQNEKLLDSVASLGTVKNIQCSSAQEAVFNLQLSLHERKLQFKKFCLVIINEEIEQMFAKAYEEGKKDSSEALYRVYWELRSQAEMDGEQAIDSFLDSIIPRGLEKPSKAVSRFPKGRGR